MGWERGGAEAHPKSRVTTAGPLPSELNSLEQGSTRAQQTQSASPTGSFSYFLSPGSMEIPPLCNDTDPTPLLH